MQPVHQTSDWRMATARLGEARLKGAYAWKAMLDNRVPLAFGSDVPVESPNPFSGIAAAITREDASGRSEERREGKSVSVRVDLGGRRSIKKKNITLRCALRCLNTYHD